MTTSSLILEVQGSFENDRRNSIRAFKVSGTTVKRKLYAGDSEERYFHIYYDDGKKAGEREIFEDKIDRMSRKLRDLMGEPVRPGGDVRDRTGRCDQQGDPAVRIFRDRHFRKNDC